MREDKSYPIMYHYTNSVDNDKKFILDRMRAIPKPLKNGVSNQYERIYQDGLGDCRRLANEYLHSYL